MPLSLFPFLLIGPIGYIFLVSLLPLEWRARLKWFHWVFAHCYRFFLPFCHWRCWRRCWIARKVGYRARTTKRRLVLLDTPWGLANEWMIGNITLVNHVRFIGCRSWDNLLWSYLMVLVGWWIILNFDGDGFLFNELLSVTVKSMRCRRLL